MEIDYDISKPEESAENIYQELKRLPQEIRKNLQEKIWESSLIKKENPAEIKPPRIRPHITDLSDLMDIED